MNSYSRVYAAIDLDAVESNMRAMKDSLPPSTSMIGVVKTDGYGHGAVSYTHLDVYKRQFVEKEIEAPISMVSNGPGRDDIIMRR